MKIIELDLNKEDKKYFCKDINEVFEVKGGNLVTTTRDFSLAELLLLNFEEIKIEEMRNPYEIKRGRKFYFVARVGIEAGLEDNYSIDDGLFNAVNYFNNKNYAEYIAFKENLMRRMDRFAWENNSQVIDWNDETQKFFIYYSLINKKFKVDFVITMQDNNIYFSSREVAEKALEKFKDDLIKLYTWEFDF